MASLAWEGSQEIHRYFGYIVALDPVSVKVSLCEDMPLIPDTFPYAGRYTGTKRSEGPRRNAAINLLRLVQYRMFGVYGTAQQLQALRNEIMEPYLVSDQAGTPDNDSEYEDTDEGPGDESDSEASEFGAGGEGLESRRRALEGDLGGRAYRMANTQPDLYRHGGPAGSGQPLWSGRSDEYDFFRIWPVKDQNVGLNLEIPSIYVRDRSKVLRAFVLNFVVLVFSAGRGFFNAWQAGIVKADAVDLGLISEEEAKAEYCLCPSDEVREATWHVCMSCFVINICAEMIRTEIGDHICAVCASKGAVVGAPSDAHGMRRKVKSLIYHMVYQEQLRDPAGTQSSVQYKQMREEIFTQLSGNLEIETATWHDAYDDKRTYASGTYGNLLRLAASGARLRHPLQMTLDAPFNIFKHKGRGHYHHKGNVVTTTDSLNMGKRSFPPCIVPWLKAVAELWAAEKMGAPRNSALWEDLLTSADHIRMIAFMAPFTHKGRRSFMKHVPQVEFEKVLPSPVSIRAMVRKD